MMILELLLVSGIVIIGSAANVGLLFLLYGYNLTVKFYIRITPGILLLILAVYIWRDLGGIYDWMLTLIIVPLGAGDHVHILL